jgi:membrane protein DedA with SNARE-associated domain
MPAALLTVPANIGYPLLFVLVAAESAGALVPGETSLIVAAALAAKSQLSLPLVIAFAAAAAILGDNVGYLIGRRGLRPLLDRPRRWSARRTRLVARGETFFVRHGSAAVFFGRWLPGLRVAASWLAGANRMRWRRFLLWNALGGIAWASTVGAAAYLLGRSAAGSLGAIGFAGLAIAAVVYLVRRIRERLRSGRREEPASPTAARPEAPTARPGGRHLIRHERPPRGASEKPLHARDP